MHKYTIYDREIDISALVSPNSSKPTVRRSLPYLGIGRFGYRNPNVEKIAESAMRRIRHTNSDRDCKFTLILRSEEVDENWCEAIGHKPSNVNPTECDCGIRRFDD